MTCVTPGVNIGLIGVHRVLITGIIQTLDAKFMRIDNPLGLGLQLAIIFLGSVLEQSKIKMPGDRGAATR